MVRSATKSRLPRPRVDLDDVRSHGHLMAGNEEQAVALVDAHPKPADTGHRLARFGTGEEPALSLGCSVLDSAGVDLPELRLGERRGGDVLQRVRSAAR
jgi:hypothetical protein